ncbi:MAG: hypothetical protein QG661_2819, partial [Actinomycetota bacterium]|nr:hypothetical protein [Actinomycetota bacterium]
QAMADGRTVLLPVLMQDTAIAVMRLREALADDLMRQAYRDGVKQDQAAAAWLMLEL